MKPITKQLSINPHALLVDKHKLYGSRGILGIHKVHYDIDFDIYTHVSDLASLGTSLFELKAMGLLKDPYTYSNSTPKYGKTFLVTKILANPTTADLLIFTDERDVQIMDKVLDTLSNSMCTSLLTDKGLRVSVYNYALQQEGFLSGTTPMSINTKKVYDLIVSNPLSKPQALQLMWHFTEAHEPTTFRKKKKKESTWLTIISTKLRSLFTRR